MVGMKRNNHPLPHHRPNLNASAGQQNSRIIAKSRIINKTITNALRPYTIDFHVAQNDGTVFGSGSHDKTGRHCLPTDTNGKLDIATDAGYWMRDSNGELTKAFKHICWDGCMFPNEVLTRQQTWNDILRTMIKVRSLHGWYEAE